MSPESTGPTPPTFEIDLAAGAVLYIPTVYVVGVVADIDLASSLLANVAIFLPLALFLVWRLKNTA